MKKYIAGIFVIVVILFSVLVFVYWDDFSPVDNRAATATPQELKQIGLFDVTTYGADSTGNADSTVAIQKAINDAYKKDGVVFFPPGEYKVTDTLVALKDRAGEIGTAFHFVGSTAGSELPTIKLAPGKFNDGNASNDNKFENTKKKAVIHMWTCHFTEKATEGKTQCDPPYDQQLGDANKTNGNTAMLIGNSIQNLKISTGENNPDAIGIRITGNQKNALSNVYVDAVGAFAGIYGSVGINSTNQDITVKGGKYGIYGGYGGWGAYTNVTLIDQEVLAFTSHQGPAISLNGFEVIKDSAPAIGEVQGVSYGDGNTYHGGSFSLNDGVITFKNNSNQPAIDTQQGRQIAVVNVYVNKAAKLIRTEDADFNGNANGWSRITSFANTMKDVGQTLISGQLGQSDYIPLDAFQTQGVSAPNTNALKMNHGIEKGRIPSPDVLFNLSKNPNSGVVNVADRGITPQKHPLNNSSPDYADKLNELFSNPSIKYVFLPKGVYPIKKTITLGKDTHLVGVAPIFSEIRVHPSWTPGQLVDAMKTVNDASATTTISNVQMTINATKGNNNFNAIHWQAGRKSVIYHAYAEEYGAPGPQKCKSVSDQYGNERYDYLFDGNGGGRVWGTSSGGGGCSKYHEKYRGVLINGTTQPLIIYGLNPEDGHGETKNEREGYMAEIRNAKNVSIRSHKSEDANSLLIKNSENIFILNPGGSIDWALRDNSKIEVMNIVAKFIRWTNKTTGGQVVKDMIEEEINGNITQKFRTDKAVSIIKRGNVDMSVWDLGSELPVMTPTPSITPGGATNTPTPGSSVTPSPSTKPTPPASNTPPVSGRPPSSSTPTATSPQGNICGKADVDGNGMFTIGDFDAFAKAYGNGKNTCADKDVNYGACGGRDANRDGKLNIWDFGGEIIGFSQRYYPRTSCSLN